MDTEKTRVMLEITKEVRSRFVNLLELIRYMQIDTIPSQFSENDLKKILLILNELPAALPEIIRCKECKWFIEEDNSCMLMDGLGYPTENDFCSYAERI